MLLPGSDFAKTLPKGLDVPRHESLGRLNGLRVQRRQLQGQARCLQLDPLARRGQHPIVANAFRSRGQHMQQEAVHKLRAIQSHRALATMIVGTYRKHHLTLADCANALELLMAVRCV